VERQSCPFYYIPSKSLEPFSTCDMTQHKHTFSLIGSKILIYEKKNVFCVKRALCKTFVRNVFRCNKFLTNHSPDTRRRTSGFCS